MKESTKLLNHQVTVEETVAEVVVFLLVVIFLLIFCFENSPIMCFSNILYFLNVKPSWFNVLVEFDFTSNTVI